MFTIDDFNIYINRQSTTLTFDELDFDNIYSLDLFGKDEFSDIIYLYYMKYDNAITFKLVYTGNWGFSPSYSIELDENSDVKASILNALNTAVEYYNQDVANFFLSDEYRDSELGKYIYNMYNITNEDILHIADIIRRGCLDFKLDPKFDLHFTKYRLKKSDEVVPIDLDAFLYNHILKVDY